MDEDSYYDDKGVKIKTWNIKKNGYTFHCAYNHRSDFVEVTCQEIPCVPKKALAKASGHILIASILASEIIRENT